MCKSYEVYWSIYPWMNCVTTCLLPFCAKPLAEQMAFIDILHIEQESSILKKYIWICNLQNADDFFPSLNTFNRWGLGSIDAS